MGVDPVTFAGVEFDSYFKQIFENGVFYRNPYPGNLMVKAK